MRIDFQPTLGVRRALFVFFHLAACLAVLAGIVWPIQDLLADRDLRIAEQQKLVARLTAVAAWAPAIRKLSEQARSSTDRQEFLRGPNDGVITANLQSQLTAMTEGAGGRVRSIRALQPSTRDGIRYLGAHIDMWGTLQSVQQTVYSIESAMPYLFVVGAVIKPSPQAGVPNSGAANNAAQPVFDAEFDIVGALQPEGPS